MDSLIVLLELEPATEVIDAQEVDIGARVRWVHAALGDPQAPPTPLPPTLCGLAGDELEQEEYRPTAPDEPWYPPEHATRHCLQCDAALRRS
ncbi:hypothetical protein [Kitasatospora azatica]|uniref:hypothetical protein n=1 Tax=Kitasatospora azatica TaxID=58347 RepID=UPI00056A94B0|nr:hypothetical protein [Kitasatospora azatica]